MKILARLQPCIRRPVDLLVGRQLPALVEDLSALVAGEGPLLHHGRTSRLSAGDRQVGVEDAVVQDGGEVVRVELQLVAAQRDWKGLVSVLANINF